MFIYQGQKAFYLWNSKSWNRPNINWIAIKAQMIKIGITGSLASGKQQQARSFRQTEGLQCDDVVKKIYKR